MKRFWPFVFNIYFLVRSLYHKYSYSVCIFNMLYIPFFSVVDWPSSRRHNFWVVIVIVVLRFNLHLLNFTLSSPPLSAVTLVNIRGT